MTPTLNNPLVKIGVLGVGGAGCNAVNMMIEERNLMSEPSSAGINHSIFNDITIIAANTDSQDLQNSLAETKIQLGANCATGWGAGAKPEVGRQAAEESKVEIAQALEGLDMVFITGGMGGGTGTGAAPIIAQIAKQSGILTIGVVTMPFNFEGKQKMKIADEGVLNLKAAVDTLVIIPNQKLVEIANNSDAGTGIKEMFQRSNVVLLDAVRNISEMISVKSYINVDFADVKSVMTDLGIAMIGFGSATGENAAINAVREALNNPLLSDISIRGATRSLLHLGGMNIPLMELNEASEYVSSQIHEDAIFIWGASADESSDRVFALIVAEAAKDKDAKKPIIHSAKKIEAKDQSTFYDVAEAATNKEKIRSIISSEIKGHEINEPIHHSAASATSVPMSRTAKAEKLDDEEILFQLPESVDMNDFSIPSIFRQQKKKESIRETIVSSEIDSLEKFIHSNKKSARTYTQEE